MKYYLMSIIVRDDGISDNGAEEYLSRETLKETFEMTQAAGIDAKVVSIMECVGPDVSVYHNQAEDKTLVDILQWGEVIKKLGPSVHYGLCCVIIKLNEVFQ